MTLSVKSSLILGENKAGFRIKSHIVLNRIPAKRDDKSLIEKGYWGDMIY